MLSLPRCVRIPDFGAFIRKPKNANSGGISGSRSEAFRVLGAGDRGA